jgi:hypothetical protein
MINKKMENSVRSLVNLYTVIIGVALSLAVVRLVNGSGGLMTTTAPALLLFAAFVATLFPFYHGALRHLDDAYIENDSTTIKTGALVFDFILLFAHGLVFVVLALLISVPNQFAWVLIVLLGVDVLWGVFAHFAASSAQGLGAELKWSIINFIFVCFWTWYLVAHNLYLGETKESMPLAILIFVTCVLRSIADYASCTKFYFPE